MKKLIAMLLAMVMVLGLVACAAKTEFCLESLINACHCYLYDICGASLNRCVDGVSLGIAAYNGVS